MSKTEKKLPQFGTKDKCARCGQAVYLVEKVVVDGKTTRIFHNYCLRCSRCDKVVSLGNYVSIDDTIFCKPHYALEMQERKTKGLQIEVVRGTGGSTGGSKETTTVQKSSSNQKEMSDEEFSEEEKKEKPQETRKTQEMNDSSLSEEE